MPKHTTTACLLLCLAVCLGTDCQGTPPAAGLPVGQSGCQNAFYDATNRVGFDPPFNWTEASCGAFQTTCVTNWKGGITASAILYQFPQNAGGLDAAVASWVNGTVNWVLIDQAQITLISGQPAYYLEWFRAGAAPDTDNWIIEVWADSAVGHVSFSGMYFGIEPGMRAEILLSAASLCSDN